MTHAIIEFTNCKKHGGKLGKDCRPCELGLPPFDTFDTDLKGITKNVIGEDDTVKVQRGENYK